MRWAQFWGAACLVMLACAPGAQAMPRFGVAEPHSVARGDLSPQVAAEKIAELGGTIHRFPVQWYWVEPSPPGIDGHHTYDFSRYEAIVAADVSRGIQPLPILIDAPVWAWPEGVPRDRGQVTGIPPGPDHYDDFAAFAATVAERFQVSAALEIWNEPNLSQFWGRGVPGLEPNPAAYTEMLRVAKAAVEQVTPEMNVLGGSMSPLQSRDSSIELSYAEFTRGMVRAGAMAQMDGIAIHANAPHRFAPSGSPYLAAPVEGLRAVLKRLGVAPKPIWLTEFGVTTTGEDGVSERGQAERLARTARWALAQRDLAAFIVHALSEPSYHPAGNREIGFGITRLDGRGGLAEKPAFRALRETIRRGAFARGLRSGPLILSLRPLRPLRRRGPVATALCESPCRIRAVLRAGRRSLPVRLRVRERPGAVREFTVLLAEGVPRPGRGQRLVLQLRARLAERSESRRLVLR